MRCQIIQTFYIIQIELHDIIQRGWESRLKLRETIHLRLKLEALPTSATFGILMPHTLKRTKPHVILTALELV